MKQNVRKVFLSVGVGLVFIVFTVEASATALTKKFSYDYDDTDQFGTSVAISGNDAIVGAPYDDELGSDAGSMSIFHRDSWGWSEQKITCPSFQSPGDKCGYSVAIDGRIAVVGCPDADVGRLDRSGKAIILRRRDGYWTCEAVITATDAGDRDFFGRSVSVSGSSIAVSAPYWDGELTDQGAVYLFGPDPLVITPVFRQKKRIIADNPGEGDKFGSAIDFNLPNLIVGAPYNDDDGSNAGIAYIFDVDIEYVLHIPRITVTSQGDVHSRYPQAESLFGYSVSISEMTAAVGAPMVSFIDPVEGIEDIKVGLVTIFEVQSVGWNMVSDVSSYTGQDYQNFGISVDITPERLLVGAWQYGYGGAAFSFQRINPYYWRLIERIDPLNGAAGDRLGWSVSIDEYGDEVRGIAGAPGDDIDVGGPGDRNGSVLFMDALD